MYACEYAALVTRLTVSVPSQWLTVISIFLLAVDCPLVLATRYTVFVGKTDEGHYVDDPVWRVG